MGVIITILKQKLEESARMKDQHIGHPLDVTGELFSFANVTKVEIHSIDWSLLRYQQAHKPIIEQETIEGHSVRAMYLLTAVADLARIEDNGSNDAKQLSLQRLWTNMVDKKMYLTGGIGAQKQWEGFGIDYFLPSGTDEGGCYAETCAAIGVMMLAERLLQVSEIP